MSSTWVTADRGECRAIMAAWEGLGHSVAHPRRLFDEPSHTATGNPAVFTAWAMGRYLDVARGYFDADQGPARTGIMRVMFWLQPGRGGRVLDEPGGLYEGLLAHVFDYDTYLVFCPPIPVDDSQREGQQGDVWHVEGLEIPFVVA